MSTATIIIFPGTRSEEGLCLYRATFRILRERYPDAAMQYTIASEYIRHQLAKQGLLFPSVEELAAHFSAQDISEIAVRPFLLTDGETYRSVMTQVHTVTGLTPSEEAHPLLASEEVVDELARHLASLAPERQADEPWVFLAHGHTEHRSTLTTMTQALRRHIPNAYLFTLKDAFAIEELTASLPSHKAERACYVTPFFLTHGCHTRRDIYGDDERAFFPQLRQAGFTPTPHLQPFLAETVIRDFLIDTAFSDRTSFPNDRGGVSPLP